MGIYSTFNYDDRPTVGTKYGDSPRFPYNVDPFTSVATNYGEVELAWSQPQGKYTKIRLVRNQDGFPETEEDGVTLWSWLGQTNDYGEVPEDSGFLTRLTNLVDNDALNVPKLLHGVFAYYRIWLYTELEEWVAAGDTYVLVPKEHSYVTPDGGLEISTQDKFLDLLPKVFTTATQSPIDEVDKDSALYHFMSGLTFTLDEVMSYADSLLPEYTGRYLSPELVSLASKGLNLQLDSFTASKNQKRLIREAYYIYNHKGTETATTTYVEGLTGWAPILTESPNKMLSPQDSSFYKGIGSWKAAGNCVLTSVQERTGLTELIVPRATDFYYSGKVVIEATGASISNGKLNPVGTACHVSAGTVYNLTAKFASDDEVDVYATVTWYDRKGAEISSQSSTVTYTPDSNWSTFSFYDLSSQENHLVAPGGDAFPVHYSVASNVVEVIVGQNHGYQVGQVVTLSDSTTTALNGQHTLTSVGDNTLTWEQSLPDSGISELDGILTANGVAEAHFASVEFSFIGTGTVYVDMVQLAEQTVSEYYEGKCLTVFLSPKKTNWIKNPSFNPVNTTSWYLEPAVSGELISSTFQYVTPSTLEDSIDATHMLELTVVDDESVGLWTNVGEVELGKFYSFSVHLATRDIDVTNVDTQISVSLHDPTTFMDIENPTDVELGASLIGFHSTNFAEVTNDWLRHHLSVFIQNTSPRVWVRVGVQVFGSTTVLLMDDAQLEIGYAPSDHFDGDIPASFGAVWEGGIVNASNARSHIYPNKGIKITRLNENLREFLPINTPYIIETYAGIETRANP
jgi:hypothetical protein